MSAQGSIPDYLDELSARLTGPGAEARRFLIEVESHLLDARDSRVEKGLELQEAEASAIDSFGTAMQIAHGRNRVSWRSSRRAVVGATAGLAIKLVAVGMILIGIAGGLTQIIANFGFVSDMYGLPANVIVPASSCAHWLTVEPTATTCLQAGTLEASHDLTVVYLGIGVIGLLLSIPLVLVRLRRRKMRKVLPPTLGPAIGAAMFGAAAVGLSVLGATNAVVSTTWGAGMWLTDAGVALVACGISVALLFRAIGYGDANSANNMLTAT